MRLIMLWLSLIVLLAFFGVGKALYHEDNTIDVHNFTNNLVWNESIFSDHYVNTTSNMSNSKITAYRMVNIIYKGADAMGYIAIETAKWGVEVGFRNPEWSYIWFIKWVLVIALILCFSALIIPLIYVSLFIGYGIYIIIKLIKTKWRNKKCI